MTEQPKAATEQEWLEFRDRLEGKREVAREALRARVKDWPPVPGIATPDYWFNHIWDNRVGGEAKLLVMRGVRDKEIALTDLSRYIAHHILLDKRPMDISPQKTPYLDFPGAASVERFLDDFVVFANSLVHESGSEYRPKTVSAVRSPKPNAP